jgi:hypothetical protein
LAPAKAVVTLDGRPATGSRETIGAWTLIRQKLGPGKNGAHVLDSDMPVGLQIEGYGFATGYATPGGLNLKKISRAPVIIE